MALRVQFHVNRRLTTIQALNIAIVSFPKQFGHA
jgi:hypothetical protein